MSRTPTNPRHTADCLKGEAMLCAAEVDERCRSFAITRTWPDDLPGDQVKGIQTRLCCAKAVLEYLHTYPSDEKVVVLQSLIPDPNDAPRLIEWLLIPIRQLFGDAFLEGQSKELQALIPPGELERLWAEDVPLHG